MSLVLQEKDLLIRPSTWLAFFAASAHWWPGKQSSDTDTPRSLCCETDSRICPLIVYLCLALLWPKWSIQHFFILKFMPHSLHHVSRFFITFCISAAVLSSLTIFATFVSSANLGIMPSNCPMQSSMSLMNMTNSIGPNTEPCITELMTLSHSEYVPFS